ncbi:MAG: MBOAT family protein [Cytophagales bacterium]|nr:MAG: MBOAT family protein [Cytophagales bacterium]
MLFNSFEFLIFFPLVIAVYFLLPHRWRWLELLFASCVFYMAFVPEYILILGLTIVVDYYAGIWIENTQGKTKKRYLVISIIVTCLILFVFKYFYFVNDNLLLIANFFGLHYPTNFIKIILPIGLSFHTFQSLSYVIEVYRGKQKAEKHFGVYALYVMYFPQLVAGPIERPQNVLHQFYIPQSFDVRRISSGLKLMAWGFFKKVVIADRLSVFVNLVYNDMDHYTGWYMILATVFFAFQIYCDFSGYSDIAIGISRVIGIDLMKNFDRPYFSQSISEFWRRWHISLSTWFKDYVYIPMGGNRVSSSRQYLNLFTTFSLSGIWHGANWTYVFWGSLNGVYLIIAILINRYDSFFKTKFQLPTFLLQLWNTLSTFVLICLAWVFFRANNFGDAFQIIYKMKFASLEQLGVPLFPVNQYDFNLSILFIGVLMVIEYFQKDRAIEEMINTKPLFWKWAAYVALILIILNFGVFESQDFIYFQF